MNFSLLWPVLRETDVLVSFSLLIISLAALYYLHGVHLIYRPIPDDIKVLRKIFRGLRDVPTVSLVKNVKSNVNEQSSPPQFVTSETLQPQQEMRISENSQVVKSAKDYRKKAEREARKEKLSAIKLQQRLEAEERNRKIEEKEALIKKRQVQQEKAYREKEQLQVEETRKIEEKNEEEYQMWKKTIEIKEEGEAAGADQNDENLFERFISLIKYRKVVILEDFAAEFAMKTRDVISRIKELEKSGELNGIFDDRGKFLYITDEEMNKIAENIKIRGRISKEIDLPKICNTFVSLERNNAYGLCL